MARGEGWRGLEKGMGVVARVLTCIYMVLVEFSAVTQAIFGRACIRTGKMPTCSRTKVHLSMRRITYDH